MDPSTLHYYQNHDRRDSAAQTPSTQLWSPAAQARRTVPDARVPELFVSLHGMLFTDFYFPCIIGLTVRPPSFTTTCETSSCGHQQPAVQA